MEPSPPQSVSLLLRQPWQYRGEGGANLVLSLASTKTVARFNKSKYASKDTDTKVLEIAYFANEVMRPLLGRQFVRPLRIGYVSDEELAHVRLEVQPFRPTQRRVKDITSRRMIISHDCVFLTPDYAENTTGPTYSFEIKPKQGWHSLKATCAVDLCHRCLKQYAKLYQGEIDAISKYCPLDLFSGDKARMKTAIFDLFENPNNRFKMFRDGQLVYTDSTGSPGAAENELKVMFGSSQNPLEHLASLLCTSLLAPLEEQPRLVVDEEFLNAKAEPRPHQGRGKVCDTRCHPLPRNCILRKILDLQRHTKISDHEAKTLCDKLLNNVDDLEGLHQLVLYHPRNGEGNPGLGTTRLTPSERADVAQLHRFLLSVTAKDVSLLLTFRELEDPALEAYDTPVIYSPILRKHFRLMISVIDLDPKSVHRISSWVKRKEEWLNIYFNSVNR